MKIILASQSEGRKKLLTLAKIPFEVIPSNLDEEKIKGKTPLETLRLRAKAKAENVVSSPKLLKLLRSPTTQNLQPTTTILLSADSGVIINDILIGKPKNLADAVFIFSLLSGRTHLFITAVYIVKIIQTPSGKKTVQKVLDSYVQSKVTFKKLSNEYIKEYLSRTNYRKYAGGYTLFSPQNFLKLKIENLLDPQTLAPTPKIPLPYQEFILKIQGSPSNVIGLPLEKIIPIFKNLFVIYRT